MVERARLVFTHYASALSPDEFAGRSYREIDVVSQSSPGLDEALKTLKREKASCLYATLDVVRPRADAEPIVLSVGYHSGAVTVVDLRDAGEKVDKFLSLLSAAALQFITTQRESDVTVRGHSYQVVNIFPHIRLTLQDQLTREADVTGALDLGLLTHFLFGVVSATREGSQVLFQNKPASQYRFAQNFRQLWVAGTGEGEFPTSLTDAEFFQLPAPFRSSPAEAKTISPHATFLMTHALIPFAYAALMAARSAGTMRDHHTCWSFLMEDILPALIAYVGVDADATEPPVIQQVWFSPVNPLAHSPDLEADEDLLSLRPLAMLTSSLDEVIKPEDADARGSPSEQHSTEIAAPVEDQVPTVDDNDDVLLIDVDMETAGTDDLSSEVAKGDEGASATPDPLATADEEMDLSPPVQSTSSPSTDQKAPELSVRPKEKKVPAKAKAKGEEPKSDTSKASSKVTPPKPVPKVERVCALTQIVGDPLRGSLTFSEVSENRRCAGGPESRLFDVLHFAARLYAGKRTDLDRYVEGCSFCSDVEHKAKECRLRKIWAAHRAVHFQRPNAVPLCGFLFCRGLTEHLISACPDLHWFCDICGERGHFPLSRWCGALPTGFSALQREAEYERAAPFGALTRFRHHAGAELWKFVPGRPTFQAPVPELQEVDGEELLFFRVPTARPEQTPPPKPKKSRKRKGSKPRDSSRGRQEKRAAPEPTPSTSSAVSKTNADTGLTKAAKPEAGSSSGQQQTDNKAGSKSAAALRLGRSIAESEAAKGGDPRATNKAPAKKGAPAAKAARSKSRSEAGRVEAGAREPANSNRVALGPRKGSADPRPPTETVRGLRQKAARARKAAAKQEASK